jgi:diaminopimelate epimerase
VRATLRFAKYHGLGNDRVISADPAGLALTDAQVALVCDRRTGSEPTA